MNAYFRMAVRTYHSGASTPNCKARRSPSHCLPFLDELRAELWRAHGLEIERRYHEDECQDAALDGQGRLELDDPPF